MVQLSVLGVVLIRPTVYRAAGNVLLSSKTTGLPKDSVTNVSQIIALDRSLLTERVGRLGPKPRAQILHGIDVILGR